MAKVEREQVRPLVTGFLIDKGIYTSEEISELGEDWHFFDELGLPSILFADLLDHLFDELEVEIDFSEVDIEEISTLQTLTTALVEAEG